RARLEKLGAAWRTFGLIDHEDELRRVRVFSNALESLSDAELGGWDIVFHAAASTDLGMGLGEARRTNLLATQALVSGLRRAGFDGRFVHCSTAYVAGRKTGVIAEEDRPSRFYNHYERSKWESEEAVRASGLSYTILRPSIVVGRSDNGYVSQMKVLYSV